MATPYMLLRGGTLYLVEENESGEEQNTVIATNIMLHGNDPPPVEESTEADLEAIEAKQLADGWHIPHPLELHGRPISSRKRASQKKPPELRRQHRDSFRGRAGTLKLWKSKR